MVLFNLGGPDGPAAVRPFLFNLFMDPAIIGAPAPLRTLLAAFIAWRRAPKARAIYARLGGASPLLEMTQAQAGALEMRLRRDLGEASRVFVAMRYWHPRAEETAIAVRDFDPDDVVLVPLYPQFSTTTTASSLADWRNAARRAGLAAPTRAVCCYPTQPGLVAAQVAALEAALAQARRAGVPRVLFSAHGLPEKIIAGGDPYAWQVGETARAVADGHEGSDLDWVVCYQSRVGPQRWIGPDIATELHRAAADGVPVVVVPIAFVSEHSETLVELDEEYASMARELAIPAFVRVPALGTDGAFIGGLAGLVGEALAGAAGTCARGGDRLCPEAYGACGHGASAETGP